MEEKETRNGWWFKKIGGQIRKSFFVTNCDTFFDFNFNELFNFHKKITSILPLFITSKICYPIWVYEINNNNEINRFTEKPVTKHKINTGLYLIKPSILKLIPKNKYFDMTDLIKRSIEKIIKLEHFH